VSRETDQLLAFMDDSLAKVAEAVKEARRELRKVRANEESGKVHPDFPERLSFPVLDRAQTAAGAAVKWRDALERARGGR
jgi:hypothetical protein